MSRLFAVLILSALGLSACAPVTDQTPMTRPVMAEPERMEEDLAVADLCGPKTPFSDDGIGGTGCPSQ
jgi:hypothetical protein